MIRDVLIRRQMGIDIEVVVFAVARNVTGDKLQCRGKDENVQRRVEWMELNVNHWNIAMERVLK